MVHPHPTYFQWLHIHTSQKSVELKVLGSALSAESARCSTMPSACGSGTRGADCCTFTSRSLKAMENSIQGEFREIAFLITGQEFSPTSFTLA